MKKLKKQVISKKKNIEAYAACGCLVAACGCSCGCGCTCPGGSTGVTSSGMRDGSHAGGYQVRHQNSYTSINGSQSGRA